MMNVCAFIRHPTLREGQTTMAINYLRALKFIYNNIKVIDTTKLSIPYINKYGLYITEAFTTILGNCDEIHLLNTNKVLPVLMNNLIGHKRVFSYQFSYLPKTHSNWRVKRIIIESGSRIVIGSSQRIAELFKNGVFIKPPIDTELFKPRDKVFARKILNLPVDKRIIGYVGDIDERRGFNIVAELASAVSDSNIKFLITSLNIDYVSRSTTKNLMRAIRKGTLILIPRRVPIWYIYNAIDLLLLPIYDDYPTEPPATLLEALSSGTPVIGGLSFSMHDYRGLYMAIKPDEWYEALSLINDHYVLSKYSKKAREHLVRHHRYEVIAEELRRSLQ